MKLVWVIAGFLLLSSVALVESRGYFPLPVLPEPELYGNLIIDENSTRSNIDPVSFSHWFHRQYFTCNVCHDEIGFSMDVNGSDISEADNRAGRFCGTCHNGLKAFNVADEGNCKKCHNSDKWYSSDKFKKFSKGNFPATPYGNRIDWVLCLQEGLIKPVTSLNSKSAPKTMTFEKELGLAAEWNFVPPAIFPHDIHLEWMNCSLCHPDLFVIKEKGTKHFRMREILKGNFCGACHLTVAFPMDDCERCHPGME